MLLSLMNEDLKVQGGSSDILSKQNKPCAALAMLSDGEQATLSREPEMGIPIIDSDRNNLLLFRLLNPSPGQQSAFVFEKTILNLTWIETLKFAMRNKTVVTVYYSLGDDGSFPQVFSITEGNVNTPPPDR